MSYILYGIGLALFSCGFTTLPSLPNGVKVTIQEHPTPLQCASFRVILTHPYGELVYALDTPLDSLEPLCDFFAHCSAKARGITNPTFDKHYAGKFAPALFGNHLPQKMGVIAVGDFSSQEMYKCIESYFGDVTLDSKDFSVSNVLVESSYILKNPALKISFPVHSYASLKEYWKLLLLQKLLQECFESCAAVLEKPWFHTQPYFLYPTDGFTLLSEEGVEEELAFFLLYLRGTFYQGLSLNSFIAQKQRLIQHLSYLNSIVIAPDSSFLASYYKDQFLLDNFACSPGDFLKSSLLCVEEIEFEDVLSSLNFLVKTIQLTYPKEMQGALLTKESIEELIEQIDTLLPPTEELEEAPTPYLCSFQENDSPHFYLASHSHSSTQPFYDLHLTNREKEFIHTIITTMAHENLLQLAFSKGSLEKKGKRIECVHPLRFLGFILSNRELKDCLKIIRKSSFKWDHFIKGFSKRMKEEYSNNNLQAQIPGFAEQVGTTPDQITPYIHKKDWEGLVKSLM